MNRTLLLAGFIILCSTSSSYSYYGGGAGFGVGVGVGLGTAALAGAPYYGYGYYGSPYYGYGYPYYGYPYHHCHHCHHRRYIDPRDIENARQQGELKAIRAENDRKERELEIQRKMRLESEYKKLQKNS